MNAKKSSTTPSRVKKEEPIEETSWDDDDGKVDFFPDISFFRF